MFILICAPDDTSALWARDGLVRRGVVPFELIFADSLVTDIGWEHRFEDGRVSTDLMLRDGRRIRNDEVSGVLNRLSILRQSALPLFQPSERYYVAHEFQALLLSWLHSLSVPVINRPTPLGLSGRLRHVSEWIWLASRAGLPNRGYSQSSQDTPQFWDFHVRLVDNGSPVATVIVANGEVTGATVPPDIQAGCRRLSELSKASLLGIDFVVLEDMSWQFAGVSTSPDLRFGGEPLLDALATALNRQEEARP